MMFFNAEYQEIIDKINKIRSYGLSKMLTIPQIAILGDQSSGKSSVLEAITKLSFPRDIETCTKFATQVSMRQSTQVDISARIDDEPEFNKRYQAQDKEWDIHAIISDANKILCSSVEISEKVLEITISGPTLLPLTIIDLPGFINTTVDGQDKSIVQTIRSINTKYIKDSRTIILAVVPANVDLNNIFVLGEAERYDPANERTIPIVTKPDTIESDLLPNLIQTLLNKRKYMKLGYLVMRNSSYKDIKASWDDSKQREEEFFGSSPLWKQVPDTRKGRVAVKKFLGELLYNHIKKELPSLKKDIFDMIGECEKEIADMGPPVSNTVMAKIKYMECIMKLRISLTALLDGNYSFAYISKHKSDDDAPCVVDEDSQDDFAPQSPQGNSHFIRSSLYRLYLGYDSVMNKDKYMLSTDEISKLIIRYKGNELPGFVSFGTFIQIYTETLVSWRKITEAHVANMHSYLHDVVTEFISQEVNPLLKDTLLLEFNKFYRGQAKKIDDTIEDIFTDEAMPFTMNKYYYDNILNSRREKVEEKIQELVNRYVPTNTQISDPIKLQSSDINYNESIATEDVQAQLQSYCKVARKRIVDVVLLQTIERHMIKQINVYFDMLIAVDESTITSHLVESTMKIARRQELNDKVAVLQKSLREL